MQCEATKPDGSRCRANAVSGGRLCHAHSNPAGIAEAGRRGGQRSKPNRAALGIPDDWRELDDGDSVAWARWLRRQLASAFEQVRDQAMDTARAHALSALANSIARVTDSGDLGRQVLELRGIVEELKEGAA